MTTDHAAIAAKLTPAQVAQAMRILGREIDSCLREMGDDAHDAEHTGEHVDAANYEVVLSLPVATALFAVLAELDGGADE